MVIQSSATPSPPIRRIEWSTAGEVLGGEAAAFTPWLSRNLDVIRDALGIDELDLVATEVDVAGKRLDILAAASEGPDGTQLAVAIEAQYGVSNHDHLGKLLTYTAARRRRPIGSSRSGWSTRCIQHIWLRSRCSTGRHPSGSASC